MASEPTRELERQSSETRRLIVSIRKGGRLIFAGLNVLALAILVLAVAAGGGGQLILERELHYVVMAGLIAYYLYVQRLAP
jgi:hypothetical protein